MIMTAIAVQEVEPIINGDELAVFINYDLFGDDNLKTAAKGATEALINFLGYELLPRERRAIYKALPYTGTPIAGGLTGGSDTLTNPFALPYSGIYTAIINAAIYGEDKTAECFIIEGTPALFGYPRSLRLGANSERLNAIDVLYTAGNYPTIEAIPADLRQAALLLAGFMFDHRACDASEAIVKSGAFSLAARYRLNAGALF